MTQTPRKRGRPAGSKNKNPQPRNAGLTVRFGEGLKALFQERCRQHGDVPSRVLMQPVEDAIVKYLSTHPEKSNDGQTPVRDT